MNFIPLKIAGSYEISSKPFGDHRGYFKRTYDRKILTEFGIDREWMQENESLSRNKHTVRGLHFQKPPHAETKLVRVVRGSILDVFVDLRLDSPTYGQWGSVELSADKHNMVYIPRGCAHGFCTLEDECLVVYKVDNYYAPEAEGSIRWNDPDLNIAWPVNDPVLSEKDQKAPFFNEFESPFK